VRPLIVAVTPGATANTFVLVCPLTARVPAPGPEIVTLVEIVRKDSRSMVPVSPVANVMVSPDAAEDRACLSEPAPESAVVVTVKVVA